MNPPQPSTSYHSPPPQQQQQHSPYHNNNNNKHYSPHLQDQQHPQQYSNPNIPRASHLHLPAVNTYIEHYHYYNFNGNCTVQQASADGQPNTIHMAPPTTRQPHYSSRSALDVPPVPPPVSTPLQPHSQSHQPFPHRNSDPYSRDSPPHLAPLSTSRPTSTAAPHLPLHSSLLPAPRLTKPPPSTLPDASQIQPSQQPPLLPSLRTADPQPPILAPLQASVPSSLSPLHPEEKLSTRPNKRSRISRGQVSIPLNAPPPPATPNDTNCPSPPDDRPLAISRGPTYPVTDRHINTTNSSSPSQSDYPLTSRTEAFERTTTVAGSARATRNADESQSNDWEAVVEMYTTGKGTEDGVALKMITKGDGRRVSDRKLLEKRRTIGKTYECLGVERFERAIGYKWENGVRRKQKMYHVISRCRVVNAMRKAGEPIPTDCDELTRLINERIAEKEALKAGMVRRNNAGSSGVGVGRIGVGGGGAGVSGMGYSLEEVGRIRVSGSGRRESSSSGMVGGEVTGLHGGRSEKEEGHNTGASGGGGGEDEIRPGRANDGGRYG